MSKDEKEICLYCRWWQISDVYKDIEPEEEGLYPPFDRRAGRCRVRAPLAILAPATPVAGVWPETWGGDWCGEFKERPE